jgi:hypothetical protein
MHVSWLWRHTSMRQHKAGCVQPHLDAIRVGSARQAVKFDDSVEKVLQLA